jgi:hypothetical protein
MFKPIQKEIKMSTHRLFNLIVVIALVAVIGLTAQTASPNETSYRGWHTSDAFEAFQEAGLPTEIPELSKDERDLFVTEMPVESAQFVIPGQGDPAIARGIIFSVQNRRDLLYIRNYYASLNKALPQYSSWIFIKDNLVLQINRNVPEAVAKQYAQALNLLDGE